MPYPFEVSFDEIQANLDCYVDQVFACLTSEFLVMPKGPGFVEFPVFDDGYEALKRATSNFEQVTADAILPAVYQKPIGLIVLRCILGFTPSEWAYFASQETGVQITQSAARTIDRKIRMNPDAPLRENGAACGDDAAAGVSVLLIPTQSAAVCGLRGHTRTAFSAIQQLRRAEGAALGKGCFRQAAFLGSQCQGVGVRPRAGCR